MALMPRGGATRTTNLSDGWRLSLTPADACPSPHEAARLTDWIAAPVPGTVAQALEAAGRWRREAPAPLHDNDAWYRLDVAETGPRRLCFEGLATFAEAWLDETPILTSTSMFQPAEVAVDIPPGARLWICFRALAPRLTAAKGPRARWRPFMIEHQGLRFLRTTLLGHMPGWCPAVHAVGPWRPIRLIEDGPIRIHEARLTPAWTDGEAQLRLEVRIEGPALDWRLECAGAAAPLEPGDGGGLRAELRAPAAKPWWPHTHGDQPLYPVMLRAGDETVALGRTGFRSLEVDRGPDGRGFGLRINGEAVFCRGACWIPPHLVTLAGDRAAYEPTLRLARDAGMNMIRVTGVGVYESPDFFALCDELGLMVWQDFMFANFDYPAADPVFAETVRREAHAFLTGVQASPSLAVLCGGSEVMQQAAMMGLPPSDLDWPLFDEILPAAASRLAPGLPYVCNSPSGGAVPFAVDEGVGHYYGVGAYERPLEDARRANVRFASECLAFANVPQPESLRRLGAPHLNDPLWKARTPRDRGASWDFEDVRDHYLARLFGHDPHRLRRENPELYLDLSRAVTGQAMAAVFAEWRRSGSSCGGGLVWLLRDFEVGAGWGLIDATGEPKPAWHALKRVLQPVQVLMTEEGVNGLAVHAINETAHPLSAELRLAAFADEPGRVIEARRPLELGPRETIALSAFELMGRFYDLAFAYRFGPRTHEAVFAQLVGRDGEALSEAVHLLAPPAPRPGRIEAELEGGPEDWRLRVTAERFQPLAHISDPAFQPLDDWFALAPGEPRIVRLLRREQTSADARPQGEVLTVGGRLAGSYGGD